MINMGFTDVKQIFGQTLHRLSEQAAVRIRGNQKATSRWDTYRQEYLRVSHASVSALPDHRC